MFVCFLALFGLASARGLRGKREYDVKVSTFVEKKKKIPPVAGRREEGTRPGNQRIQQDRKSRRLGHPQVYPLLNPPDPLLPLAPALTFRRSRSSSFPKTT